MTKKKTGILFCLTAFIFQVLVFPAFLSGLIIYTKIEAEEDQDAGVETLLTQEQYKKLHWLNESEIAFGDYLLDIKKVKQVNGKVLISYSVDLKEKSFLEKRIEDFRQNKNKKTPGLFAACKISEPCEINFIAQITTIQHQSMLVPACSSQQDTFGPPPKA